MRTIRILALCLAAFAAGGAEVKRVAPDGVNEITLEVDGRGNVQSESVTTVHVPECYYPQSGDWVVINDVSYIVIHKPDWERFTNAVARLEAVAERRWKNEHATEAGRRAWHGAVKSKTVAEDGSSVEWVYADGYVYVQNVAPARRASPRVESVKNGPRSAPNPNQYKHLPARLRAKRQAQDAQGKAREVNAVFGPGGKVLKVEEAK